MSGRLDRHSGQLYLEKTMTPQPPSGPSWVHETPFLPEGWEGTSAVGAPTLKHSAMRQALSNQRNLTPELFAHIAWPIASYLWDCLGRSRKRTLYMWKLFATAYPVEFPRVAPYRSMKITGLKLSMRDYLGLVKNDALRWRVVLTIATSFARVPEIVEIAQVKNLAALEIATPRHIEPMEEESEMPPVMALSDRIVRTWSEMAQTGDAFAHLRVLRLYHQDDLSAITLRYLRAFPALRVVVVYRCPGLSGVSGECMDGWEAVVQPAVSEEPAVTLYSAYNASLEGLEGSTVGSSPILDFQVGQRREQIAGEVVCLQRRERTGRATKRQKVEPRGRRERKVMRGKGRDINDVLGDFF